MVWAGETDEAKIALADALSAAGPLSQHSYGYGYGGECVDTFEDRYPPEVAGELMDLLDKAGWKLVRK